MNETTNSDGKTFKVWLITVNPSVNSTGGREIKKSVVTVLLS